MALKGPPPQMPLSAPGSGAGLTGFKAGATLGAGPPPGSIKGPPPGGAMQPPSLTGVAPGTKPPGPLVSVGPKPPNAMPGYGQPAAPVARPMDAWGRPTPMKAAAPFAGGSMRLR